MKEPLPAVSGKMDNATMREDKPDIFLCHNKADKEWVRELGARLEAETIDGEAEERKIRVFLDEWDIEKGENFVSRLGEELSSGAFVAVIMSPEFFDSDWTRFEWTDVVARDPSNKAGRLLPLRYRDISLDGSRRIAIPAPFNALNSFDFRSVAQFEPAFEDLLRRVRNIPPSRGRAMKPRYSSGSYSTPTDSSSIEVAERVDEVLISNLAPLTTSPPPLYRAVTALKSLAELPPNSGLEDICLMIWDGKIVTFSDLEDPECLLNSVIDPYTIERFEFEKCAPDANLINQWLATANKNLAKYLAARGVSRDEKGRFYFLPAVGQKNRVVTIGTQGREVAAKKRHHVTGSDFWVHYCADIKFKVVAAVPFLRIVPSYSFTHDGIKSLNPKEAGRFRVIWGGKQDSATVLRQILFWLRFMSEGHEEFVLETGGSPIRISVMPATAAMNVGIAIDHIRIKALVEDLTEDELSVVTDGAEIISEDEVAEVDPLESEDEEEGDS